MLGTINTAGTQESAQQLRAAKHVQRQLAVRVVVAMKEAALLLAVQRVVGSIKVQHQLSGCSGEAGDELLHQHCMQFPCGGFIRPFLQTAQGRGAGNIVIDTDSRLHRHVLAQCSVVVQILPAQPAQAHTHAGAACPRRRV